MNGRDDAEDGRQRMVDVQNRERERAKGRIRFDLSVLELNIIKKKETEKERRDEQGKRENQNSIRSNTSLTSAATHQSLYFLSLKSVRTQ